MYSDKDKIDKRLKVTYNKAKYTKQICIRRQIMQLETKELDALAEKLNLSKEEMLREGLKLFLERKIREASNSSKHCDIRQQDMEKWRYKSLEWIHKVREEDYNEIKTFSPKELIEKTRKAAENTARELGLKIIRAKTPSTQ